MNKPIIGVALLCASVCVANAASLAIEYSKSSIGGGLFQYDMTMSIDTSVSAWAPGMGWSWVILGDVSPGPSPLADLTLLTPSVGPWTEFTTSSGGHNGPTFAPLVDGGGNFIFWTPVADTDTLSWSCTSTYDAPDNTLQFSELVGTGGATLDNFRTMTVAPVPEPASLTVLGLALLGIARRRKR